MAKPTKAGEVARQYCVRHPDVCTRTLANMLYRDHPSLFKSWETARSRVRYYRKENGRESRETIGEELVVPTDKQCRLTIPESDAEPIEPYHFTVVGRGLICGDIHLPYHDKAALESTLEYALSHEYTDWIILNGDILDAYQVSKFVRDPRKRSFKAELEMLQSFLRQLKTAWPVVIYKCGNHEQRYWNYMLVKAPELVGIDALEFEELAGLREIGVEYVAPHQVIYAGELTILHGHEYGRSMFSPVNPARGAFLRAHACTVSGHLHRGSHHPEPDVRRRLTSCWSHGCLCDLTPEYAPLNKWNQSFILMDWDGDWFEINPKSFLKGRVV